MKKAVKLNFTAFRLPFYGNAFIAKNTI